MCFSLSFIAGALKDPVNRFLIKCARRTGCSNVLEANTRETFLQGHHAKSACHIFSEMYKGWIEAAFVRFINSSL